MKYKGARIQVLDLPGIIEGAADGKGRGRQVISTARTCNLILIVLDSGKPVTHKKIIEAELNSFGIRINQKPPEVKFIKREQGGIDYQQIAPQTKGMNADVCRSVLKEYKISCATIILREDITVDQFIDVIEGNRAYIPVLYVFNKMDAITIEELGETSVLNGMILLVLARLFNMRCLSSRSRCPRKKHEATSSVLFSRRFSQNRTIQIVP